MIYLLQGWDLSLGIKELNFISLTHCGASAHLGILLWLMPDDSLIIEMRPGIQEFNTISLITSFAVE